MQYLICSNCEGRKEGKKEEWKGGKKCLNIPIEDLAYNSLPLGTFSMCKRSEISYHSSSSLRRHPTHPNRLLGYLYLKGELCIPLRLMLTWGIYLQLEASFKGDS